MIVEPELRAWLGMIGDELIRRPMTCLRPPRSVSPMVNWTWCSACGTTWRVRSVGMGTGGQPVGWAAMSTLATLDPTAHQAILEIVGGGYFSNDRSSGCWPTRDRSRLRCRLRTNRLPREELLERVVHRGPVYRVAR